MRAIFLRAATAALALFVGVIVYFTGCGEDKGTNPDAEPAEHLFYVGTRLDGNRSLIKTFSVEQRAFIDSFVVDSFEILYMSVIGDNDKLLLSSVDEGVRFYDINSKELVYSTGEYCCGEHVSKNSEYYDAYTDRMLILNTENYSEIYQGGYHSVLGSFSFNSVYSLYTQSDSLIVYNIEGDSIEGSYQLTRNGSTFRIYKIWPTVDMSKLFLIGNQGRILYFAVTDFGGDSVRVLQAPLRTAGEDAAVSPDGNYLYFVNTPYTDHEMPRMKIDVYDVNTEQLVRSISTAEYDYFEPQEIALTADGKYLLATPYIFCGHDVLLVDAQDFSVIGSYNFGYQVLPEVVCTKH